MRDKKGLEGMRGAATLGESSDISIENVRDASEEKRAERRRFLRYIAGVAVAAAAAAAAYYALTAPPASPPTLTPTTTRAAQPTTGAATTEIPMGLSVASDAFGNGERIPSKYTCDGEDVSPPINWSGGPEETRSYALIVDDMDAPAGVFTHWVIFNIPATETGLQENLPTSGTFPNGAIQGRNGFGKLGYGGACPPSGVHRYVFHLYALDTLLKLQPGATKQDVLEAIEGHVLAQGELAGLYSRG